MRRLLLLCLAPFVLAAQPADPASVSGQVLNAVTGEPLKKAIVTLRGAQEYHCTTNPEGRFTLAEIKPGDYRLSAQHNGFVTTEYGARRPGRPGTPLTLTPGQAVTSLALRLTPTAVVTGRVLDEDGDPVRNAKVEAQRYLYNGRGKDLMIAARAATNDLGEYRIFDLLPGKYYVAATAGRPPYTQTDETYVTTFYPGTKDMGAATQLDIAAATQLRNIDFTLIKAHTVRIRGRIVGDQPENFNVILTSAGGGAHGAAANPKGEFEIPGVLPGSYVLIAHSTRRKISSGRRPLEVGNGNLEGVVLTVSEAVPVTGRIRIEGEDNQALAKATIQLQPFERGNYTFGPYASMTPGLEGNFRLENVLAERYAVVVSELPEGYYIKSVRSAGVNVLGAGLEVGSSAPEPLEIVISPKAGQVTGTVINPDTQQRAPAFSTVTLIPREKEPRLYRLAMADAAGHFTFRSVIPGEYSLFAFEDVENGAWLDPDFMKPFEAKGQPVTIQEGSREDIQLKLIPAGEGANLP